MIRHLVLLMFTSLAACSAEAQTSSSFSTDEVRVITSHGPWPQDIPPDPGNEFSGLPWAEELGAELFFDPKLSNDGAISCGSCHQPELGFGDGQAVAVGAQRGNRNTQGLVDVGFQRWFGWDGGADSLWSAAIRPMLAEHEMNNTVPQLAETLRQNSRFVSAMQAESARGLPTNSTELTVDISNPATSSDDEVVVLAAKSIAAFTRTIQSERTAFDDFRDALVSGNTEAQDAYPEEAKRGLKIFLGEANCGVCHFGADFSNGEFHDTGRPFFTSVGQVDPGRYTGIQRVKNDPFNLISEFGVDVSDTQKLKTANVKLGQENWGQWRTPTLRNLKSSAPYMHDGSLLSLRDVVDAYADIDPDRLHSAGESILKPLQLNDEQRNDLVAFLMSLSVSD